MKRTVKQSDFRRLDRSLRIQKIIDTATELFHKKGYRSTTLDDVARELGITKAALYHYVSSKEKLLSIIYIQALENIFKNVYKISERDLPPDERLRLIIQNHIKDIIIQSLSMFSVFFTEENQLPESDYRKIQEEKKKYTQIIERIIQEGISQGLFREADPKLQAYAIIGMCNWVYKWYKPGRSFYSPDEIANHFVNLLQTGYLKDDRWGEHRDLAISEEVLKSGKAGLNRKAFQRLKLQCMAMITLIEGMEKSG